jgi:hypothetical protein
MTLNQCSVAHETHKPQTQTANRRRRRTSEALLANKNKKLKEGKREEGAKGLAAGGLRGKKRTFSFWLLVMRCSC